MFFGVNNHLSTYFNDLSMIANEKYYKISKLKVYYSSTMIVGIQTTYYLYNRKQNIKSEKHKAHRIIGILKNKIEFD